MTLMLVLVIGWLLIGLWFRTENCFFLLMLLIWTFVGNAVIGTVKCPSCGIPVSFRGRFGSLGINAAVASTHCKNCGHDLTLPSNSK